MTVEVGGESAPGSRRRRNTAWVFGAYALGLTVLTHWPRLTVAVEGVERPDLFVHLTAYSVWTILLARSGLMGDPRSPANVPRVGAVALIWSGLDELSQSLPFVHRHASWQDLLANWAGVMIGLAVATAIYRIRQRDVRRR